MGNEHFTSGMWEYLTLKRAEGKRIRHDAAREKQEGIQGQSHQDLGRSWSLPEEMKTWSADQKLCAEATSQIRDSRWDEFEEKCIEKKNLKEKHGLCEANHCVHLPALQQFSSGALQLVVCNLWKKG